MEKKKYNLRSTKSDSIEVPVQLQISNDNDFVTNLLGSQILTMAQQESQNSSSDSELDCSALVNETDSDDASNPVRSFNRFEPEASTSSAQQNNSQDVQAIQNRKDIHTIAIPSLGQSPLCPSRALQALLAVTPGHNNSPLFTWSTKRGIVPLTDSVARKHLKQVSQLLGFHPHFKFHDFRRSGATWAFHQGVPLHHIMHHGTWQSDSVWKYIKSTPQATSPVASAFQRALLI